MGKLCQAEGGAGGREKAAQKHQPGGSSTVRQRDRHQSVFERCDIVRTQVPCSFSPRAASQRAHSLVLCTAKKLCCLLFSVYKKYLDLSMSWRSKYDRNWQLNCWCFTANRLHQNFLRSRFKRPSHQEGGWTNESEQAARQSERLSLFPLLKMACKIRKRPQLPTHPQTAHSDVCTIERKETNLGVIHLVSILKVGLWDGKQQFTCPPSQITRC